MTHLLNFVTWNVQGLGHVIKRKKVLTFLKRQKIDIALLQETRLSDLEHSKLKRDWVGQVYFSSHSQNKRGTAILIKRNIPFTLLHDVRDPEGRFILIKGLIFGRPFTILNVYAPNTDSPNFISQIVLLFNQHCDSFGFMGGDFNCIHNARLDKSSSAPVSNPRASSTLKGLCMDSGLIDVWRTLNPNTKDYSFFSHPHNSYSRLDYFFTPKHFLYSVQSCLIGPITISDHAPVYLQCDLISDIPRTPSWKYNTSLLNDDSSCAFVRKSLSQYWADNSLSPVSPAIIWDAAKATMRGQLISYCSFRKKTLEKNRRFLESEVVRLEQTHKQSSTPENFKALIAARTKLNIEYTNHARKLLLYTKQNYYEFGNRSSRLLAHQLKKQISERSITAIKMDKGKVTYDPSTINKTFRDFYKSLYSAGQCDPDGAAYLNNISLPSITEEDLSSLDAAFSPNEVWAAIQSMPNGKSPGSDGFPVEFFKKFWLEI
uniref:Endonuclease/exonuclease/phosphatase domain-containing protein n=1 Tax=Nothobranchius furzeri TaxID=105023 RepID=A0A1A7ZMF0_NOTFU